MSADDGNSESKGGHHKFEELRIGAPTAAPAPFNVTIDVEGDYVVMKFAFRLRREEALKFAAIMLSRGMATKP